VDFSRNNKVLAVAGDKGQVVVYSNRPHPPSGDRSVGRFPDLPKAGLDCITCVRFAPSDTHLIGGARTGTVHIWSLRSKEVSCNVSKVDMCMRSNQLAKAEP
jgi:WD40 repeat protein